MEIRPFTSEYSELRSLMQQAWPSEHSGHIDFTQAYLREIIESEDTDPQMTLGAYIHGKLICFMLSKKKRFLIHGKEYPGLLNTLATTDPNFSHLFPYIKLKDTCVKKAISRGYRLNAGFAAWGIKNNRIEKLYSQKNGFNCSLINSFGWLGISPQQTCKGKQIKTSRIRIERFDPLDADTCLKIMNQAAGSCLVFEKWDKKMFIKRFSRSQFCDARVVRVNGKIRGFTGFLKLNTVTRYLTTKVWFLYHLFLDALEDTHKRDVICSLIKEADDLGTDGISVPNTGYFKTGILKQIGFREFGFQKYKTNFYITMYKDQIPSGQNQRFYVEIV